MKHHNWTLDVLENMMPFERDIYVSLLKNWIEEENRKTENKR